MWVPLLTQDPKWVPLLSQAPKWVPLLTPLPPSKKCVKCPEWCYINDGNKGYQSCSANSDCENFGASKCLSHCAMI